MTDECGAPGVLQRRRQAHRPAVRRRPPRPGAAGRGGRVRALDGRAPRAAGGPHGLAVDRVGHGVRARRARGSCRPRRMRAACACTWTARASPTPSRTSAVRRPRRAGAPASTCCRSAPPRTARSRPRRSCSSIPRCADELALRRKRGGHLWSKLRFLSAQLLAYLDDDLWLRNARHANAMAQRLAQALTALPGIRLAQPVEANELFVAMPAAVAAALRTAGFHFYDWPAPPGVAGPVGAAGDVLRRHHRRGRCARRGRAPRQRLTSRLYLRSSARSASCGIAIA